MTQWHRPPFLLTRSSTNIAKTALQIMWEASLPKQPRGKFSNCAIPSSNSNDTLLLENSAPVSWYKYKGGSCSACSCGREIPTLFLPMEMTISLSHPLYTHEFPRRLSGTMTTNHPNEKRNTDSDLFVSSPYAGTEHHLDLMSVPETSRQLAIALQILQPTADDYPSQPYSVSFNWQQVVNQLPSDFSGS